MTLYEAFLQIAARNPGQPAVIDLGTTLTYAQLRDNIGRLSNYYQAEIPRGATVALLSGNGWAWAQTIFALSNSGCPFIVLSPAETDGSLLQDLRALSVTVLLTGGNQVPRAQDLVRREKLPVNVIEIEKKRAGEYDTSFRTQPDRPIKDTDPVLVARMGDKGTQQRYSAFNHKQLQASVTSLKRFYRLTPNDRMLTTMSWSHPFALTHGLLLPLFSGGSCVVDPESPTVEDFLAYLAAQRVTRFAGAPKFYFQLLSYCAAHKYPLPGVKSITLGMGTLSLALRKTYQLLKIPVLRCYGRPEAVWSLAMDDVETALDIENAKSRPVQGVRMAVLTEDGEEIPGPSLRVGRLSVMSEALCPTYFAPEKAPNESFRGTWLLTDEIARLEGDDDELTVAVLGKMSDMLPSEGDYLSPRRIDQAALKIPGLEDAAGFVRFDRERKPHFAVAVVMNAGRVNERDLLAKICEDLPDEYHPRTIHVVDSLPRDAFDSVNRQSLQRLFLGFLKMIPTLDRRVLFLVLVASLGYFVDIYDLILFSVVRVPSLRSLGLGDQDLLGSGVLLLNLQMLGMLVGGLVFGVLGDKLGRISVLFGSILLYSLANLANAFVHDVSSYAILRFVAGFGLAGELGAGITLVAETLPKEKRGLGTTLVASVGVSGALLAWEVASRFDWRTAFVVGGVMGLLLLCLRVGVLESGMFRSVRERGGSRGNLLMLVNSWSRFRRFLGGVLVGAPLWYAVGILMTLAPEFGKALGVTGAVEGGRAVFFFYAGLVLGDLFSGLLSQLLQSRRRSIFVSLTLLSAATLAFFCIRALSPSAFYALCCALGFSAGYWAMFVTVAAEQFGTNLRATVATTTPNFVRGSLVLISGAFLGLKGGMGIVGSAALVGGCVMVLAFVGLWLIRETYGLSMEFEES